MRVRVFGACATTVMIWIAGCGSTSSTEHAGQSREGVQGGTVDQTHSYAVGVCIGDGPSACNYLCSGALIAPNLVVSARHCVSSVPNPMGVDCTTDHFGGANGNQVWITTNYRLLQSTIGWHQVKKINVPTNSAVCGNDISLLILADNVSAAEATPITPGVQYSMTDHVRYSTSVTAIGYGNTQVFADPTNSDAGTRHIRQDINIVCIPGDPVLDCGNLDGGNAGLTANEFYSGDGTCEGDSGSSAYEQTSFNKSELGNGRPVSFGVLSRGGQFQTTCSGGIYTRLDKWRDLVVNSVKEAAPLGGYPLPPWTAPPATTTDGGKPAADGGVPPGQPGAPCDDNSQCNSKQCATQDGTTFVCAAACTPGASPTGCDKDFTCVDLGGGAGGCFATTGSDGGANGATTTTSGCAVALRPARSLAEVPWKTLGFGAFALLALRRRRR